MTVMTTKTAREAFTQLEKLLGEYASEIMDSDLENLIWAAENAQEDVAAITAEERANLADDEEFVCERELQEALEKVEEAFEKVIEAIDNQRERLSDAEVLINKAFGCDIEGGDEEEEAAAA